MRPRHANIGAFSSPSRTRTQHLSLLCPKLPTIPQPRRRPTAAKRIVAALNTITELYVRFSSLLVLINQAIRLPLLPCSSARLTDENFYSHNNFQRKFVRN